MTDALTIELARRVFGNLGVVKNKFGMVGITTPEFTTHKAIQFSIDDNSIVSCSIFFGEINLHNLMLKAAISNISIAQSDEFQVVLILDTGKDIIGLFLDEFESVAMFMIKQNESWIPLSVIQKLNVTLLIESITQQGVLWNTGKYPENIHKSLLSLVDHADI